MNQRDLIELHSRFLNMGWQIKAEKSVLGYAYRLEKGDASASISASPKGFNVLLVGSDGKTQGLNELAEDIAWDEIEKFVEDNEFIAERIAALEESVEYFGAANKAERERWVVQAFLKNMGIQCAEEDVVSPDQDPPDVIAFDGAFEVKEILDPGRKRHKEYKDELERVKQITDPQDLLTPFRPKDSSIAEIYQRCLRETEKLNSKYAPRDRESMDLLFYVNLEHIFGVEEKLYPDVSEIQNCGWRSVSFVKGQVACCFCASEHAPEWLSEAVGDIRHKVWGRDNV